MTHFSTPNPAPNPPGEPFRLPPQISLTSSPTHSRAPQLAEWTRTAGPDQSLLITGVLFSDLADSTIGADAQFLLADGSPSNPIAQPRIQRLEADKVLLTLPTQIDPWQMYLLWPLNKNGAGQPIAINQTQAWWLGPDQATPGATLWVHGRNLSHRNDTLQGHLYLLPRPATGGSGRWLSLTQVNPYRLGASLPADLPPGEYEVWAHNGHGGAYGWSGPLVLRVVTPQVWAGGRLDVRAYGAVGDGQTDDTGAIRRALVAARQQPGSTVYFPAGVYLVSDQLELSSQSRWQGEGPGRSIVRCGGGFSTQAFSLLYGQVSQLELADMAFEANRNYRGNYKGTLNTPIFLRGSHDVKLTNLRFSFEGYNILDLHLTKYVFLTNCELIGMTSFLGTASQLFIDRCHFRLTNDTELALHSWSGVGISLTRSTCQDLDNRNPASGEGWGKGRFFVEAGVWGSSWHTYIAHNTTRDLAPRPQGVDQNVGEQFLWEGNLADYSGQVSSSTPTTTRLQSFTISDSGRPRHAVIIKGRGLGQSRRIVGYEPGGIHLATPWRVLPDASSVVVVGNFVEGVVLYQNYIDGKASVAASPTHVASAGIQPYGGVLGLIADGNTIQEVRVGLANWATQHQVGVDPNYFNLYVNNHITNCRWGIQNSTDVRRDESVAIMGTVYRNNVIINPIVAGINNVLYSLPNPNLDGLLYEHNTFTGVPTAFTTERHFTGPFDFSAFTQAITNQFFYRNRFISLAPLSPALALTPRPVLRENTFSGFASLYQGSRSMAQLELPQRVLELAASPTAEPVEARLPVWNSGSSALNWQATSSVPWLELVEGSGRVVDQGTSGRLMVRAAGRGLAVGEHQAWLRVVAGEQVKYVKVKFTIIDDNTSQSSATITILSPKTNTIYKNAESIPIAIKFSGQQSLINKVSYFIDSTQLGESLTAPFSFTWNSPMEGVHWLLAKGTDISGNVIVSAPVEISVVKSVSTPSPCTGTGSIDWVYWGNRLPSATISTIPLSTSPTFSTQLNTFATPFNISNYYGSQAKGFLCPPMDGNYIFYIAGDDLAELYLSTNADPANMQKIASADWTCQKQYDRFPSQQSVAIPLQAGQMYYIEVRHIEGSGDDYVFVGWKLPDGTVQRPILGDHLIPFKNKATAVSTADLSILLIANKRVVKVGDTVSYRVMIRHNGGSDKAVEASWTSQIPANLQIIDHTGLMLTDSSLSATVKQLGANNDTTFTFRAKPGAPGEYRMAVQIMSASSSDSDSTPGSGTADGEDDASMVDFRTHEFYNDLFVSSNNKQRPLPKVISNEAVGDSLRTKINLDLISAKRAIPVGDVLNCHVVISNTGNTTIYPTQIRVELPSGLRFVSGSSPLVTNSNTASYLLDTLAKGRELRLPFQVKSITQGRWIMKAQIFSSNANNTDLLPAYDEANQVQIDIRVY